MSASYYSGTEVDKSEINAESIDHDNLPSDFLRRLQTLGTEKTLTDIEKRRLEEYLQERTKMYKGTAVGNIVGILILVLIIAVPLCITYANGNIGLGIVWTVIVAGMMAVFFILDKKNRITYGKKVDVVKDNRFKVYTLPIDRKVWCKRRTGTRRRRRYYYVFFIQCSGMTLQVDEITYEALTKQAVIAVFTMEKATAMDIMTPKELGLPEQPDSGSGLNP